MTGYVRKFDGNVTISFKISDKQLLKKQNQMWTRFEKLMITKFDSEPVYGDNDKYIKTKIKAYNNSIIINFQCKRILKGKAPSYQ